MSFEELSVEGIISPDKEKLSDLVGQVKKISDKHEEIKDVELTNELFTVISYEEVKVKQRKSGFWIAGVKLT